MGSGDDKDKEHLGHEETLVPDLISSTGLNPYSHSMDNGEAEQSDTQRVISFEPIDMLPTLKAAV